MEHANHRLKYSHFLSIWVLALFGAVAIAHQAADVTDPQKLWALVIGISNYAHAEPLRYAASDAQSVAEFLKSPRGGAILPNHLFTLIEDQATQFQIRLELAKMRKRVQPGDTVYIYIAGHGYLTESGIGYFIPSDGDLSVVDPTSVPLSNLKELVELGLAHSECRILITDICNAGRIGTGRTELAAKIQNLINEELRTLRKGSRGTFLNVLASRPSEASWENDDLGAGVFTHALLEALNGKATSPGDLVVGARHVVGYLQSEVPKYTANTQHPMFNDDYDPSLALSFLNKPGPPPKAATGGAVLEILNTDKTAYSRVQWMDPKTYSTAVRQLPQDRNAIQIGSLMPGDIELHFYNAENQARSLKLKLERGRNTVDLSTAKLSRNPSRSRVLAQLASLSPILPSPAPDLPLQAPSQSFEGGDASLLMRLDTDTQVYLDDSYFGNSTGGERFLQLQGLTPGSHNLTLIPSPDRERRFRLRLFSGPQIFDVDSGELRAIAVVQTPPDQEPLPENLPASLEQTYRRFIQALWEERLIVPAGDSAWDYYQQLRNAVPQALNDMLITRLIVAMGNRAQRTILKYLRGGDIRWKASIFEEGATLIDRTQQLFEATASFESQRRFFAGRALIEHGEFSRALPELQRAVDLNPRASHAYNAIGLAYWKQNLLEQAIPPLQRAITLSPQWTYPRNTLALVYLEQRRYGEAEQSFQSSIQINHEDSTAFHGLGQLRFLLSRFWDAELELRRAIEFNPGNAYAYETLGKLHQNQQRLAEAEQAFRLAIRLEPDEPSFHVSLADLLRQLGRVQEAQQAFARIANQHLDNLQVVQAYTRFLSELNRTTEAEATYKQALKLSPGDANLRVLYGGFLRQQGRDKDAEKQLKAAIEMAPNNPYAHHDLAGLYLSQRKLAQAENELALASKADPRLAAPPKLLGQIRFAQKRYTEALQEFRKALALSIDANQKQELGEHIAKAETALVKGKIEQAKKSSDGGKHAEAWILYAEALKITSASRDLRNAILQFQAEHPTHVDLSSLPPGTLWEVLNTTFWKDQLKAEDLWRANQKAQAVQSFVNAFEGLSLSERRIVTSTPFNIGNDNQGIHQIIYRWALRLVDDRQYSQALALLDSAIRHNIFAVIPNLTPLTIDSLMSRSDVPDPKTILDFDIAHHPDRRAHEIYASARAGSGNTTEARKYLAAIESSHPDVAVRTRVARTLGREQKWNEALSLMKEILTNPKLLSQPDPLAEAFVLTADLQCQTGDCSAARETLQEGRRLLPKNKQIETALRKIR